MQAVTRLSRRCCGPSIRQHLPTLEVSLRCSGCSGSHRTSAPQAATHASLTLTSSPLHPSALNSSSLGATSSSPRRPPLLFTTSCASGDGEGSGGSAPKLLYNLRRVGKDDVEVGFSRSSGAGGQNVNKLSTKVDMRLHLAKQAWIPDDVKDAIREMEKNRFTKDGVLVLTSQKYRTQAQNLDDALAKLQAMIDKAVEAITPKEVNPETVKKVKQNIKAGQERRLQDKKKESFKKKDRGKRVSFD